jgi:hypothetical protein
MWDNELKINSDIRDVSNEIIKNLKFENLYEPILKVIKNLGRVNRLKAINKLQKTNILSNKHPIIYNYIINLLIKDGFLKEYKLDYSTDNSIYNYDKEDEYRNDEIEVKSNN